MCRWEKALLDSCFLESDLGCAGGLSKALPRRNLNSDSTAHAKKTDEVKETGEGEGPREPARGAQATEIPCLKKQGGGEAMWVCVCAYLLCPYKRARVALCACNHSDRRRGWCVGGVEGRLLGFGAYWLPV